MSNSAQGNKQEEHKDYRKLLWFWAKMILLVWLGYVLILQNLVTWVKKLLLPEFFNDSGIFQYGTFGDSFGALNALFAGLAFAGLIVTIRQQSKDLQATREEMRNTNREFARQIIENSLFQYANFMIKVRPNLHNFLISRILDEVDTFIEECKKYDTNKTNPVYLTGLTRSINAIRNDIKEFATWRRTFAAWCHKIDEELDRVTKDENEQEELKKTYIFRLWELLTQHERRVLFLQFAFYIDQGNPDWEQHNLLVSDTKCIKRFVRDFDENSYNILLRAMHLDGPRKQNYAITTQRLQNTINDIYQGLVDKYTLPE